MSFERASTMKKQLNDMLEVIGEEFKDKIQRGSRHYLEVNIGERAERLGHDEMKKKIWQSLCNCSPEGSPEGNEGTN
jgi:hypothetical protein